MYSIPMEISPERLQHLETILDTKYAQFKQPILSIESIPNYYFNVNSFRERLPESTSLQTIHEVIELLVDSNFWSKSMKVGFTNGKHKFYRESEFETAVRLVKKGRGAFSTQLAFSRSVN